MLFNTKLINPLVIVIETIIQMDNNIPGTPIIIAVILAQFLPFHKPLPMKKLKTPNAIKTNPIMKNALPPEILNPGI